MMAPSLLRVIPPLAPELQYRFVGQDLILWDVHANLVVDVIRSAVGVDLTSERTPDLE